MSQNKTVPTRDSVKAFLSQVAPEKKQADCRQLVETMRKASGENPVMWGNIVGFGKYHYRYESGREGDCFIIGFAPRAQNLSIYAAAYNDELDAKKKQLGKVKLGKSCIYVNKLDDIDLKRLQELLRESMAITLERYPQVP